MKILFIDTETGGINPQFHSLLSIGLVIWENNNILSSIEILIKHEKYLVTKEALEINKINLQQLDKNGLPPNKAIEKMLTFLKKHFDIQKNKIVLGGHNICFDISFFKHFFYKNKFDFGKYFSHRFIDTASILKYLYIKGTLQSEISSLDNALDFFNIEVSKRHTALDDALATAKLFTQLLKL